MSVTRSWLEFLAIYFDNDNQLDYAEKKLSSLFCDRSEYMQFLF
jgi:hypothetical protein